MTVHHRNLEHRFNYCPSPTPTEVELHGALSKKFVEFSSYLNEILDEGRAKSLMLTELENASAWAHKALGDTIERLENPTPEPTPTPTPRKPAAKKLNNKFPRKGK